MDRGGKTAQLEVHEAVMRMRFGRSLRQMACSAALAVLGSSCTVSDVTSPPPLPPGTESLTALTQYNSWWNDTENCSGLRGDLSRIAWFMVPNTDEFEYRGKSFNGYWWSVHWVVLASPFIDDPGVVRHEMLHDLL